LTTNPTVSDSPRDKGRGLEVLEEKGKREGKLALRATTCAIHKLELRFLLRLPELIPLNDAPHPESVSYNRQRFFEYHTLSPSQAQTSTVSD